jgi:ribonuclease Y
MADPVVLAGVALAAASAAGVVTYTLSNRQAQARSRADQARFEQELTDKLAASKREAESAARAQAELAQSTLAKWEERLVAREQGLDDKRLELEAQSESLRLAMIEAEGLRNEAESALAGIAQLTPEAARAQLMARVAQEAEHEARQLAEATFLQTTREQDKAARLILLGSLERLTAHVVAESTSLIVALPNDETKGRLIGREGRNIRTFEQVTGVDLIIDDTPEAVTLSSHDPVRREVARLTLMNLILDGRIHPSRIEDMHKKAEAQLEEAMLRAGEDAVERAQVGPLPLPVLQALGRLRFRTSSAQNVLDHSVEVAQVGGLLADELHLDAATVRRAGLLHDIGKALGPEWTGPHALAGRDFLRLHGESESILEAVGAHHYEIEPTRPESVAVIVADTVSAARPGARRDNLEGFLQRVQKLEDIARKHAGVERAFAVQAGREVRLFVDPGRLDDAAASQLAKTLADQFRRDAETPGAIRITVIREFRATESTK